MLAVLRPLVTQYLKSKIDSLKCVHVYMGETVIGANRGGRSKNNIQSKIKRTGIW